MCFSNLISLTRKAVLAGDKIKTTCLTEKLFLNVIKITVSLINSDNQELIHHIHCFGLYFIIKVRQGNLFDLIIYYFMIFTLNPIQ